MNKLTYDRACRILTPVLAVAVTALVVMQARAESPTQTVRGKLTAVNNDRTSLCVGSKDEDECYIVGLPEGVTLPAIGTPVVASVVRAEVVPGSGTTTLIVVGLSPQG